ncbi:MAG: threonylcarbamoyl-AMP synthase [Bacteroidales bacterium]|nr:threonylcarbamoyl-AMP synthase [Bacteroidales bacterium]
MNEDFKTEAAAAIETLKQGGIILYPTDTVWGLGCDATNADAVSRIFEIKKRADSKSLITLVSDADMLCRYVKEIPQMALQLIEVNDKPMTIIYPEGVGLAPNLLAADGSVGIRIPMHDFCRFMIKGFGKPIVSTSANISGGETPVLFEDINVEIIEQADWIADPYLQEGATGEPSQIIKVGLDSQIEIIRG